MESKSAPRARTAGVCPQGAEMQSRMRTDWRAFMAISVTMSLSSTVGMGCRSAVDDFYKPLTGGPDSHCGGAGGAGAGATTSTGSASGGADSTGGSAGNAQTGGASSGCSAGTGGGE